MSETLRELFGTLEELKPVPVPVAAPVMEAPQLSLRERRIAIFRDSKLKAFAKIKALRALR